MSLSGGYRKCVLACRGSPCRLRDGSPSTSTTTCLRSILASRVPSIRFARKPASASGEFIGSVNRVSAARNTSTTEGADRRLGASETPRLAPLQLHRYRLAGKTPQSVNFEEYRNGSTALDDFPEHIASVGLPGAMVLVFTRSCFPRWTLRYLVRAGVSFSQPRRSQRTNVADPFSAKTRQAFTHPVAMRLLGVFYPRSPFSGRQHVDRHRLVSGVARLETDIVAPRYQPYVPQRSNTPSSSTRQ